MMIEESDPASNYYSFGLILHGDPEEFHRLKELIVQDFPNLRIIFQQRSLNHLWVHEEKPNREPKVKVNWVDVQRK